MLSMSTLDFCVRYLVQCLSGLKWLPPDGLLWGLSHWIYSNHSDKEVSVWPGAPLVRKVLLCTYFISVSIVSMIVGLIQPFLGTYFENPGYLQSELEVR